MNSSTAYYLLLLYLSVMFKPLIPIIQDACAHEYYEMEHIATIHAKYGSHHLAMELSENNCPDAKHPKNTNCLKSDDLVSFYVSVDSYVISLILDAIDKDLGLLCSQDLTFIPPAHNGPPPKFT